MSSLLNTISRMGEDFKGLTQKPELLARRLYSPRGEPAAVASMPLDCRFNRHSQCRANLWQTTKKSLALFLTEQMLGRQPSNFALKADSWGKPEIWLGAGPGPALSFSWVAGRLWAAVDIFESCLGLDVAAPEEFYGSYPHHRVFGETDWPTAMALAAGERAEAAALLWTVKEAAVKAEGHGFHFLSPKKIEVNFAGSAERTYYWSVCLDKDHKYPKDYMAVSIRLEKVWLSLAWAQ
jgi:phosphopantetheinyl transferase